MPKSSFIAQFPNACLQSSYARSAAYARPTPIDAYLLARRAMAGGRPIGGAKPHNYTFSWALLLRLAHRGGGAR